MVTILQVYILEYSWVKAKQERRDNHDIKSLLSRKLNFLSALKFKEKRKNTLGPHCDTDLEFCILVWGFA